MKFLKALALATVPVGGVFLCLFLLQATAAVQQEREDERGISGQAVSVEAKLGVTVEHIQATADAAAGALRSIGQAGDSLSAVLQNVNRPCEKGKPCGTLADVASTLATIRGTAGQVEVAARHENQNLTVLDDQEATLFSDLHGTLQSANAAIANPAIAASLEDLEASAANLAEGTKQGTAVITDFREEADKFVHPPKKKLTFWGAIMAAAGVAHKFEPPIF